MVYDPSTMVERGVVWAEEQDPFGHVMQSQYMHFLGTCFHRVMEGYGEFLSNQEYDDMIHGKTVVPALRKYELDIRRQLIAAYGQDRQAIVAQVSGSVTYMDVKTARPVDICTLSSGWPALYDGSTKKSERANALKESWHSANPTTSNI
ncbi:hypothetical protein VMCG_08761 [Cytospora schulzeri]|uniref:Uncharacterized protein n=1 Tax=Cytospora schulzeri TaxID=448051 RepID=A0A423VSA5_9PEZI|nr:hypothetical protein VMCG_08761 [Valsa malicola]